MTDSRSMKEIAKWVAREGLPPVLLRGAKAVRRYIRSDRPLRIPGTARVMEHRGTNEDTDLYNQIILGRAYDFEQLRKRHEINSFYEACANPLIIDCGANIGAASIWFGTRYPRATVVAIEPEPENFGLLRKNMTRGNDVAVHGAVASEAGQLRLFDPGMGTAGFRTVGSKDEESIGTVRAYTLDELASLAPNCTPFIVKIDIEGAEEDLFLKHSQILDNCPIVIIELHDWFRSGSSHAFLKWHTSQDRDFVHTDENVFSLCNRLLKAVGTDQRLSQS